MSRRFSRPQQDLRKNRRRVLGLSRLATGRAKLPASSTFASGHQAPLRHRPTAITFAPITQRYTETFHGTKESAKKKLRDLLSSADKGAHVAPDKIMLREWVDHWISAGAPGRRQKKVNKRTLERYAELLRYHLVPTLGGRPLQQIQSSEIDKLYVELAESISPRTAHHVHTTFGACLGAAVRTGLLSLNPMARLLKVPSPGEADHGMILDEEQLCTLVEGFRGLVLFPIVAVAVPPSVELSGLFGLRVGFRSCPCYRVG
jgi:integrase